MKVYFTICILLTLGMNAYSQEELSDEQKKVVGVLFDKYATVAGAWFVNNNCSILNEKENSEFFWYTSEFTKIVSSLKNPKMVTSIQKSAKKVSEQDKYKKCGDESKEVVQQSFNIAKELVHKLSKKKPDVQASLKASTLSKYKEVHIFMSAANRCNFLKGEMKDEVLSVKNGVDAGIKKSYPQDFEQISAIKEQLPCDKNTEKLYVGSLAKLRSLQGQFTSANK